MQPEAARSRTERDGGRGTLLTEELVPMVRAAWGRAWSVRSPACWLLLAAFVALLTATTLANDFVHAVATGEVPPGTRLPVAEASGPAVLFAQLAVAACGLHLVTPEYASGAMDATLTARPRRWVVLVATALVAAVAAAALGLVLGPLTGLAAETVLGEHSGAVTGTGGAAATTTTVLVAAALVGVGLGFLTRSAVAALSLSFVLLVVTLAAPGAAGAWLPGRAASDLLSGGGLSGAVLLAGWAALVLVAAAWSLAHRDASRAA